MLVVLLVSLGFLLYIFAGYPLVLRLIVAARGERLVRRGSELPRVSLVISAYNEAVTIREKIHNSLALDYPADRLEIAVLSDASNDGTDEIVRQFSDRGVQLHRQPQRRGKTAALNAFVPGLKGDIVVFSDANAMYNAAAIGMLVRNFADPEVGCVTGEARYTAGDSSQAATSERTYWNYEINIKRLETAVGSMVGGDGAIYAIRKKLWQLLPENAINDFLNPLQIVAAGWRGVYEPEAFCYEEAAGDVRREWKRRVRIVSRSWRAVFQCRATLNPFKVGLFAFSLFSHKVLRWFTGAFIAAFGVSSAALIARLPLPIVGWIAGVLVLLALLGGVSSRVRAMGFVPVYYVAICMASLEGIVRGATGRVSGVWTTPRAAEPGGRPASHAAHVGVGTMFLVVVGLAALTAIAALVIPGATATRKLVFWSSAGVLAYVYVGYPLLLALVKPLIRKPVRRSNIEPRVCLFITANDEAAVMESKLRNCLELDYPRRQLSIVVASDGSVDGTNDIVRSFASQGVTLLAFPERRGKIAAINEGVGMIDSEIVVFSDANTFLEPGAIRALASNFADERVGAVSGDVILVGERAALALSEDLYYRYERWLQASEAEIGSMLGVDGALYAIRRELFVPPPADTILDDMAIPMAIVRAGRRVVFEPGAVARERGSESATEEFSRKVRVVAGAVQFLRRPDSAIPLANVQALVGLLSHKSLRWMSPLFAALAFAASVSLFAHSRVFVAAVVAQVVFIGVGLLGCMPSIRRWNIVGLAHYFCLVHAAAAVGFVRGLSGRQSVAWRRFARSPGLRV